MIMAMRDVLTGTRCVQGEVSDLVPSLAADVYSLFFDALTFTSLAAQWETLGVSAGAIECVAGIFLKGA